MPSRQDSLRRMRFDQKLKEQDPEMYKRYQEERLQNRKRKERADYPPDARPKKYTEGAIPGNKAAAASMSSDRMIKKYSYGGAAIKGTKFKGVF